MLIRERMRELWTFGWLESAAGDVVYALRGWRKNPVFASTVGRLVVRVRALSRLESPTMGVANRWAALKPAMSGWATQLPVPRASRPGNTLGDTTRGP